MMKSWASRPSISAGLQRWVGTKKGVTLGSRFPTTTTTTHRNHLHRLYHSSKQPQRQRFTLRPVQNKTVGNNITRYNNNNKNNNNYKNRHHNQGIPNYVYIMGGIPVAGGLYLYVRYQDSAPLTGRRRWLATNPEYEKSMGDENYKLLLKQYRNSVLPRQHPSSAIIEKAGRRIFLAAGQFAKQNGLDSFDAKNVTFTVIQSDQANAFVLPGNHVFFLTGMFKYARTEDEIGGILGHEMAHNLARHQGEKISSNVVVNLIAALGLLVDPSGSFLYLFMPAVQLLGELPNSRVQESEADEIGMRLAAEACYDPEALSNVFRRMDRAGKEGKEAAKPPEFLSTHPSDESRIQDMQKWLPENKEIYHMHDGERCRPFRRNLNRATMHGNVSSSDQQALGPDGFPC